LRVPCTKGKGTACSRAGQAARGNYGTSETRAFPACAKRNPQPMLLCVFISLLLAPGLHAATLAGTITNGTTNKPSAGDEVILIKLAAGMEEVGHTKTDAQGKFTLTFDDENAPHLVRAVHQGVTYHTPAPPGTNSVQVQVYDVSPKIAEIHEVADVMYIQAKAGSLGITRLFAVDNNSKPPRTQMNDANFEFNIPEDAQIDEAQAQTAGGQGINVQPTPQSQKGRYAFVFPLRPGQTQFQVTYHLPYAGKRTIDPRIVYPLQHFVAILPKSITFSPAQGGIYQGHPPPDQPDGIAQIANNPDPTQKLAFEVSGTGVFQSQEQASGGAAQDNRPGGGLGAPIEAPDPLDKYRPFLLAGLGLVLVAGAVYTVSRARPAQATGSTGAVSRPTTSGAVNSSASTPLLAALKDELFQLEIEHKQGQISDQEYAKTKSALDETLARAIKRSR